MTNIDRNGFDQSEYDRRFHSDFMYDATDEDEGGSGRSPIFIVLTGLVLVAFSAVVWVAYQQGIKQGDRGSPQLITADPGPVKIAPEHPGGVTVPDQDKQIYERIASSNGAQPAPAEALAPPPEQPRDIPQPKAPAVAVAPAVSSSVEDGDTSLADPNAPPSADQAAADAAAKKQAAAIAQQIDAIDPGAAAAATKTADSGAFVAQLGSYKDDNEAAGQWVSMKRKYNDLFGALKSDIKRVDLGPKGVYYRLRVGPFKTKADAVALCAVVKTRGGACIPGPT